MSNRINQVRNILASASWWKSKGPIVCGQEYVEKYQQDMLVWKYKVTNRTYVDIADVPFGMFVEIATFNKHESYLVVYATPYEDESENPIFKTRCQEIINLNKFICKATKCQQIVANDFTIPGTNYWEASLTQIDDKHSKFEYVTADELDVMESLLWDDNIQEDLVLTEQLVQVKGEAGWIQGTEDLIVGEVTYPAAEWGYFTYYEAIKCGWWIKKQERIIFGTKESYCETRSYYWPPVLTELTVHPHNYKDGSGAKNLLHIDIKDSYNGPCTATVIKGFGPQPVSCNPTQLVTDAFQYSGLQFSFSIPACLHPLVVLTDAVGTEHPVLTSGTPPASFRTFAATTFTDWPATVIAHIDPKPYKGQYLTTTITINRPS